MKIGEILYEGRYENIGPSYKGFKLDIEEQREEDNRKWLYSMITPEGKSLSIKASPYADIPQSLFKKIVDEYLKTGKMPTEKVNM